MDLHVEVPFSVAAHAAAPPRLSALLLPPPPPPLPSPGSAPDATAAAAAAAAAAASRQALPVWEVCLLTAAVRVTAPCEVCCSLGGRQACRVGAADRGHVDSPALCLQHWRIVCTGSAGALGERTRGGDSGLTAHRLVSVRRQSRREPGAVSNLAEERHSQLPLQVSGDSRCAGSPPGHAGSQVAQTQARASDSLEDNNATLHKQGCLDDSSNMNIAAGRLSPAAPAGSACVRR